MMRALLASIFVILILASGISNDARSVAAEPGNQIAAKLKAQPSHHQGQDTPDVRRQHCFSARYWDSSAAIPPLVTTELRNEASPAGPMLAHDQQFLTHILFLYTCAPRAPPFLFRT